jgi:hypothetical protein
MADIEERQCKRKVDDLDEEAECKPSVAPSEEERKPHRSDLGLRRDQSRRGHPPMGGASYAAALDTSDEDDNVDDVKKPRRDAFVAPESSSGVARRTPSSPVSAPRALTAAASGHVLGGSTFGSHGRHHSGGCVLSNVGIAAPVDAVPPPVLREPTAAAGRATCDLCGNSVPAANLDMHRLRCARNPAYHMVHCDVCGESLPRKEMENHQHCEACHELVPLLEASIHKLTCPARRIQCPLGCGADMPALEEDEHKTSVCPLRLVECPFCHLPRPKRESAEHQEVCGSRTDVCEGCQQHVMLRNLEYHQVGR